MKNDGFTLFEIMLVIALIGITYMIIPFPRILTSKCQLEVTVDEVYSHLRWARMRAILNNETYRFRIYRGKGNESSEYEIYRIDADDECEIVKLKGEYPGSLTLYRNLDPQKITEDCYDRISFTGSGTAASGTIGFENEKGILVQIIISNMGRIRIERS